jgi:hypothetical protein
MHANFCFSFPNHTLSLSIIPCMHLEIVLVFFGLAPLLFSFSKSPLISPFV